MSLDLQLTDDIVLKALKSRYFNIINTEDRGKTPEITEELDKLETAIRVKTNQLKKITQSQIQS